MENAGGHLVAKHVSMTNQELIKRAIQEGVDATTFYSKSHATLAIQQNIRNNADEIIKWLNDSNSKVTTVFEFTHQYSIGKGAAEATKKIVDNLYTSRVVLVKDQSMEYGFRILTGFPIIK